MTPREPFVVNKTPSVNSSQKSPLPRPNSVVAECVKFVDGIFCNDALLLNFNGSLRFYDSNVDSTSTDEDSFSSNDVEYVEASPPNSEPVSSKVMEIVIQKLERIEWKTFF
ncbi:hypothetical protein Tco_1069167 [Tanacetum coccineum]|uniref:Uncharacterized protein n=1 Tax=Tanacetum coccineum TaxID=301880 RepID=A0ABQ5HJN3_9ASTR